MTGLELKEAFQAVRNHGCKKCGSHSLDFGSCFVTLNYCIGCDDANILNGTTLTREESAAQLLAYYGIVDNSTTTGVAPSSTRGLVPAQVLGDVVNSTTSTTTSTTSTTTSTTSTTTSTTSTTTSIASTMTSTDRVNVTSTFYRNVTSTELANTTTSTTSSEIPANATAGATALNTTDTASITPTETSSSSTGTSTSIETSLSQNTTSLALVISSTTSTPTSTTTTPIVSSTAISTTTTTPITTSTAPTDTTSSTPSTSTTPILTSSTTSSTSFIPPTSITSTGVIPLIPATQPPPTSTPTDQASFTTHDPALQTLTVTYSNGTIGTLLTSLTPSTLAPIPTPYGTLTASGTLTSLSRIDPLTPGVTAIVIQPTPQTPTPIVVGLSETIAPIVVQPQASSTAFPPGPSGTPDPAGSGAMAAMTTAMLFGNEQTLTVTGPSGSLVTITTVISGGPEMSFSMGGVSVVDLGVTVTEMSTATVQAVCSDATGPATAMVVS
ncbi:MAG: hypothetical protein M1814_004172 [Vezdaea aestivalis]|nr:MAG: hypothetical protein M1814_004172 [Vezdaea aestivalis]